MKGTTKECLKHYLSQLPWGNSGSTRARQPLAQFTGINPDQIRYWHSQGIMPIGLALVKTRYFLEKEGYLVTELQALDRKVYTLGKLIAHNQADYDDVLQKLGYEKSSSLLELLHGKRGLSKEKEEKIKKILSSYTEKKEITDKKPQNVLTKSFEDSCLANPIIDETISLLTSLKGTVEVLSPRLKSLLSDQTSTEQRQEFREKAGRKLVFDLANNLHSVQRKLDALCSEKARDIQREKGGE